MAAVYFVFTFGLSEHPGGVYTNSCLMFERHCFKFTAGPATPCFIVVFKAAPPPQIHVWRAWPYPTDTAVFVRHPAVLSMLKTALQTQSA